MAEQLTLQVEQISQDGSTVKVIDITPWGTTDFPQIRSDYALYLRAEKVLNDSEPQDLITTPNVNDPRTVVSWDVPTMGNGLYKYRSYAYLIVDESYVAEIDEVVYLSTVQALRRWTGSAWVEIDLEQAINASAIEPGLMALPFLYLAEVLKNKMNLEYVVEYRRELGGGMHHHELYQKRSSLDYISALIIAAQYNWSLGLDYQFVGLCDLLNDITQTNTVQ